MGWNIQRGINRDKLNGTNGAKFAVFRRSLQIFARPRNYAFRWRFAETHRKPQNLAENPRKQQNFAEARLSHLVCPFRFLPRILPDLGEGSPQYLLYQAYPWPTAPLRGGSTCDADLRGRLNLASLRCRRFQKGLAGRGGCFLRWPPAVAYFTA